MMPRTLRTAVVALSVPVLLVLGGCGGDDGSTEAAEPSTTSASPPTSTPASSEPPTSEPSDEPSDEPSEEPSDDGAVEIEIEIEDGSVSPAGKQVPANVGDKIALLVDSDTAEELHVHTAPEEHEFAVEPGKDQRFGFTVEQPGQFDVELHESGALVAQLVVRP